MNTKISNNSLNEVKERKLRTKALRISSGPCHEVVAAFQ
jgi:hypothetical protein